MPTLRDLPETCQSKLNCIIGISNAPSNGNVKNSYSDFTNENQARQNVNTIVNTTTSSSLATVNSPQAFLSRSIHELCTLSKRKNIEKSDSEIKNEVITARYEVAKFLINNEELGQGEAAKRLCTRVEKNFPSFYGRGRHKSFTGFSSALELSLNSSLSFGNGTLKRALSTGSKKLDTLLSPPIDLCQGQAINAAYPSSSSFPRKTASSSFLGVSYGIITEVFGPSSSCKTQLALTLAANAALDHVRVFYLAPRNTTVVPLAKRLQELIFCRVAVKSKLESILKRVQFISIPDGQHLPTALAKIEIEMRELYEDSGNQKIVLILDSISGCLLSTLLSANQGGSLVNDINLTLRRLARSYFPIIFVTNSVVMINNEYFPSLHGIWRGADVSVQLSIREGEDGKYIQTFLKKHYAKSCRQEASKDNSFRVTFYGVVDAD